MWDAMGCRAPNKVHPKGGTGTSSILQTSHTPVSSPTPDGVGWETFTPCYGLSPRRPRTSECGCSSRCRQTLPDAEQGGPGTLGAQLVLQDALQALRDFQE